MSSQSASHVLRRRLLAFVLGVSLFWKDAHATSICVGLCGVLLSPLSECFCDSSCVAAGTCCEGYTEACTTQPWMPGDLPFSDDYCLCEECCDHSSRNASQISVSNAGFKTTRIPLGQESSPLIPGWHRAPGTIGGTRRSLNGVAWVEEGTICQTTDEQLVDGRALAPTHTIDMKLPVPFMPQAHVGSCVKVIRDVASVVAVQGLFASTRWDHFTTTVSQLMGGEGGGRRSMCNWFRVPWPAVRAHMLRHTGGHYHMDSIVAAFDGEPFRALRFSLRAVPINAHSSVRVRSHGSRGYYHGCQLRYTPHCNSGATIAVRAPCSAALSVSAACVHAEPSVRRRTCDDGIHGASGRAAACGAGCGLPRRRRTCGCAASVLQRPRRHW
eukprot:m.1427780 g.1427780  ORF g.1427780 m.1427780 type:complete len:384 (-) comp25066_c0_seq17:3861-5012(-)